MTTSARPRPSLRRVGPRTWEAASATRPWLGVNHRVDMTLDGLFLCNCEAGMNNTECWAAKAARKEVEMTATETRELVPVKVTPPTALVMSERDINLIQRQAAIVFAGAVSLPQELNSPEKVAAVMMYGFELGLRPMTAIRHLYIVKGRVSPSAEVMAGLLIARYPDARFFVEELDDEHCVMRLRWPSRDLNVTYQVKWQDIVKAGLAGTDVNQKYPHDRMIKHATKRLLRIYAPDVINGLDAGAPVIDPGAASLTDEDDDDDFDESDLYNEGDEDYIESEGRVVSTSTGEIHEAPQQEREQVAERPARPATAEQSAAPAATSPDAPKASQEQLASITEWEEQVKDRRNGAALNTCKAWMANTYGYAKGQPKNLIDVDATVYIDVLKSCAETGNMPFA